MTVATRLQTYLDQLGEGYELIRHPHSHCSMESAAYAHIPGDNLAKGIVLRDTQGHLLLVVLPADFHINLKQLGNWLQREVHLVDEEELGSLFPDCALGAIPPIGPAYALPTIWDRVLGDKETVFFEAGDHESLVKVSGRVFHELMAPAERAHFSRHL